MIILTLKVSGQDMQFSGTSEEIVNVISILTTKGMLSHQEKLQTKEIKASSPTKEDIILKPNLPTSEQVADFIEKKGYTYTLEDVQKAFLEHVYKATGEERFTYFKIKDIADKARTLIEQKTGGKFEFKRAKNNSTIYTFKKASALRVVT